MYCTANVYPSHLGVGPHPSLDFRLTCIYLYLTLTPTPSVPEQVARVQYNPLRQGRMFFLGKVHILLLYPTNYPTIIVLCYTVVLDK